MSVITQSDADSHWTGSRRGGHGPHGMVTPTFPSER